MTSPSFSWLYLSVFFYCWSIRIAFAGQANITIDDADPSIVYLPSEAWHASSVVCSTCLNPDVRDAYLNTYHDGTHVLATEDEDDDLDVDEEIEKNHKRKGHHPDKDRRFAGDVLQRRLDSDDPGFVDSNVTAEFYFTGSAVYLFSIQPLGVPLAPTTPTTMNLSFTLDNKTAGDFFHNGSKTSSGYLPQVNVFSQANLAEIPHVLRVNVGAGSVFLFDYLVYTRTAEESTTGGNATGTPLTEESPSTTVDASTKHHNIATFAGAVGGSVGVLAVLSMGLAFSIIKRRRNYQRRERQRPRTNLNRAESLHTNASDDSPPTAIGPAPFVPTFFRGTTADPPPYIESPLGSESSSSPTSTTTPMMMAPSVVMPASYSAHLAVTRWRDRDIDMSYADIPPAFPPPPLEDAGIPIPPPPPFGFVITTMPVDDAEVVEVLVPPGIGDEAVMRGLETSARSSDHSLTQPITTGSLT